MRPFTSWGVIEAAAERLDQALSLQPGNIRFLLARSDLEADRIRTGGVSVGAGDSGTLGARNPSIRAGADAEGLGAWLTQARDRCEAFIEHEPDHPLPRVLLGAVLLRLALYEEAEASLDKAFSLAPSRPIAREAHRIMGQVREKQGRPADAARHYGSALDIDPLDAEALEPLAAIRFADARFADALALYRRLVKVRPFVAQAHLRLGMTLHRLGRYSDALAAVGRALELAPGLEEALKARAGIRGSVGAPRADSGLRMESGLME